MMRSAGSAARRGCAYAIIAVATPFQAAPAEEPPSYCLVLRDVTTLVRAKDKFASVIGQPREGNYFDTTRPLPGWADCSFYGARTYVCDSRPLPGADAAATAFAATVSDVKSCLRGGWAEDASRTSPGYAVIRDSRQAASITISTDVTDKNEHVVRLILFLRSR